MTAGTGELNPETIVQIAQQEERRHQEAIIAELEARQKKIDGILGKLKAQQEAIATLKKKLDNADHTELGPESTDSGLDGPTLTS